VVHDNALTSEQDMQPSLAEPRRNRRQLAQAVLLYPIGGHSGAQVITTGTADRFASANYGMMIVGIAPARGRLARYDGG